MRKSRRFTKVLSLVLSLVIIFTGMKLNGIKVVAEELTSLPQDITSTSESNSDGVTITKSAEYDQATDEVKINIGVSRKAVEDIKTGSEVVIIIENSGKANFEGYKQIYVEAAKDLSSKLLVLNPNNKISIVHYQTQGYTDLVSSSDIEEIKKALDNIENTANKADICFNNMQGGLHEAGKILNGKNNATIILFSSFLPSRSFAPLTVDKYIKVAVNKEFHACSSFVNNKGEGYVPHYTSYDYNSIMGYSSNYSIDEFSIPDKTKDSLSKCEIKSVDGKIEKGKNCVPFMNSAGAFSESYDIKTDGAKIYTVGYGLKRVNLGDNTTEIKNFLYNISSGEGFAFETAYEGKEYKNMKADKGFLHDVINSISESINKNSIDAASKTGYFDAKLTDEFPSYMTITGASSANNANVVVSGNSISVTYDDGFAVGTLDTVTVTAKVDKEKLYAAIEAGEITAEEYTLGTQSGLLFDLNKKACISYKKASGEEGSVVAKNPKGFVMTKTIKVTYNVETLDGISKTTISIPVTKAGEVTIPHAEGIEASDIGVKFAAPTYAAAEGTKSFGTATQAADGVFTFNAEIADYDIVVNYSLMTYTVFFFDENGNDFEAELINKDTQDNEPEEQPVVLEEQAQTEEQTQNAEQTQNEEQAQTELMPAENRAVVLDVNTENIQNVENTENTENNENSENKESAENTRNSENTENVENVENAENAENAGNTEIAANTENTEKVENTANSENTEKAESPVVLVETNELQAEELQVEEVQPEELSSRVLLAAAPVRTVPYSVTVKYGQTLTNAQIEAAASYARIHASNISNELITYTFSNWEMDEATKGTQKINADSTRVNADTMLAAPVYTNKFVNAAYTTEELVTVTYYDSNKTDVYRTINVLKGSDHDLLTSGPAVSGDTFKGWSYSSTDETVIESTTIKVDESTSLYPVYEKDEEPLPEDPKDDDPKGDDPKGDDPKDDPKDEPKDDQQPVIPLPKNDPETKITEQPEITLDNDSTPQGTTEVSEAAADDELEIDLEEDGQALGSANLPKTGTLPVSVFYVFGTLLVLACVALMTFRKKLVK